jgi:hypothetical protein
MSGEISRKRAKYPIMAEKNSFIFLCDQATESECLNKELVGTPHANAIWAARIKTGDDIYLFNFNTGLIRGPYAASSGADCFDSTAWGGKFSVQVRIAKTPLTKQAYSNAANAPSMLRKPRPSGDLGLAAKDLMSWLQECGEST